MIASRYARRFLGFYINANCTDGKAEGENCEDRALRLCPLLLDFTSDDRSSLTPIIDGHVDDIIPSTAEV